MGLLLVATLLFLGVPKTKELATPFRLFLRTLHLFWCARVCNTSLFCVYVLIGLTNALGLFPCTYLTSRVSIAQVKCHGPSSWRRPNKQTKPKKQSQNLLLRLLFFLLSYSSWLPLKCKFEVNEYCGTKTF